jgi:hypothetical protein
MKSHRSRQSPSSIPEPEQTDQKMDTQQLLKAMLDSSFNFIQVFQARRDQTGAIIDFSTH